MSTDQPESNADIAALDRVARIRALNDELRCTLRGGRVVVTRGVASLGKGATLELLASLRRYTDFSADNDPYGEHDFGAIDVAGERVFWKVDYYNREMTAGSEDPADPTITERVLTIMLADEY